MTVFLAGVAVGVLLIALWCVLIERFVESYGQVGGPPWERG